MKSWTCIEDKSFYTQATDGSQVEIWCDMEADVHLCGLVEALKFTKVRLVVYPDTNHWLELGVKQWEDLKQYVPEQLLKKIEARAEEELKEEGTSYMIDRESEYSRDE